MIESVELVVAALAAGATAGATDTASTAVQDAYQGLKTRVLSALRKNGSTPDEVVQTVQTDAVDGSEHRLLLTAALQEAGTGADPEMEAVARQVLELADPAGTANGKYWVVVKDGKGVQVGDYNTQTNNFS